MSPVADTFDVLLIVVFSKWPYETGSAENGDDEVDRARVTQTLSWSSTTALLVSAIVW